ncbi:RNA polymerase II-binding domain-containing protein [Xylariomycetidae sp. FL0641]|nr:RNA polymerase II-binding domain-containing protein [Xylariomycetidae sp. FL0641]
MAYNDDAVLAKLSALSETQDSIVTVAQWIMFHRRHADRTVQLWLQRLKDSPSHKRLNLIYLANEVTQQSKARQKGVFLVAFSPVIAEAVATAYKGAPQDIQQRIRRVVDVWRERNVFEEPIQRAVETRIQELDKARGTVKAGLGGSIFGSAASASSVPSELAPLVAPQQSVTKLTLNTKTTVNSASQDYDKLMGPSSTVPSAPVYAARLSGLLKTLAQAEGAVEQCVKARRDLVGELQKILDANRTALISEEDQLETLVQRKNQVEDKKNEVERAIMAGLPDDEPYVSNHNNQEPESAEPDRPEMEELTPPPETGAPDPTGKGGDDQWSPTVPQEAAFQQQAAPGIEMLSNLAAHYKSVPTSASGSKKRRLDDGSDFPDLGGDDGIDADVAEMLRKDSNASQ